MNTADTPSAARGKIMLVGLGPGGDDLFLLVSAADGTIKSAPFVVSSHANRVAVEHGHTICMSIALGKKASAADVKSLVKWILAM
mgnify:CR=1 FL=1